MDIIDFVKSMKPTDHVIMFYTDQTDKHLVLFTFLQAGLDNGEAAAYIVGEETLPQIRESMKNFGLNVEYYERINALKIIDYRDWYIIGGNFDLDDILSRWRSLLDDITRKGFKGLRVVGEMACFFKHDLINELVEYERALHRVLEIPISAICAYDDTLVEKGIEEQNYLKLYLDLITSHSTVLYMGPEEAGVIKSLKKAS